jgi:hypothetical protein
MPIDYSRIVNFLQRGIWRCITGNYFYSKAVLADEFLKNIHINIGNVLPSD